MSQLDWPLIIHELGLGHPMKFIWEERAKALITYPNFWKQFYRKFPQYREATITAREFEPGERVEVDYAGDPIEWYDIKTGEIHQAWVFVVWLGFSQLLYAWATEDMKSRNWLGCHRRMFDYYGGVPHVLSRLLEDRRGQMPPVRSGSERGVRALGRALLHRNSSSASRPSEG